MTPKYVYMRGIEGQSITRVIQVRAGLDRPLTLIPAKFDLEERVRYKIEEVERGRRFKIHFTNIPGPHGSYRGTLELKTNYPERPVIRIPISATFKEIPPVHVFPGRVTMKGVAGQIVTKIVKVRAGRDEPLILEVSSFDLDRKVSYRIEETEPGKNYVIYLTNIPGPAEVFSGTLRLKTNYSGKPVIAIPIRGIFR